MRRASKMKLKGIAMICKTSKSMRLDPLFMRNQYPECGQWGIPLVKKQELDISNIRLIACSDTRSNDNPELFTMTFST